MITRLAATTAKHKADAVEIGRFLHQALDGKVASFLALAELSGGIRLATILKEVERLERARAL